ncbi:UbiX family flavin prenyltransferase [Desulforudis sp. 1088]|uniref:UbiX family flavin prenyltransferase n=1 Tax=unclassified Candidatus Desulforudis TaxID=2635950 RepID=UPI003CE50BA5
MRIIVAVSGASGAVYGINILKELAVRGVETHLVLSAAARYIITQETAWTVDRVTALASRTYEENDFTAPIASGSFQCRAMVVAPCSMKTLAGIASGYAENLILRAADVTIKEQRRLILVTRETPLSPIHLENMLKLARLGAVIMPPVPAFYARPATIDDIVRQTTGRVLDLLGIENSLAHRWGEDRS